jgi:hypothetical protein
MNTRKSILFFTLALMLLVSSACGSAQATTVPTEDNSIQTELANTAQAAVIGTLTQVALSNPSDTPTPTFTETPIQTNTLVPSATSNRPMISVSKETNCRLGPDVVYDRVGSLNPGVFAEVFALDPTKFYYYIENPNSSGSYCWVWGYYATEVNAFTGLPVYTPGPTPTPANTSTPNLTTTPTVTGTITNAGSCSTVSYLPANNTKIKLNDTTKDFTWVVKNTSQATWDDANVLFKFISGTNLHNVTSKNLSGNVAADANTTLLLDINNIPDTAGTYTETWAVVQDSTTFCSLTLTIEFIP